MNTAAIILAGGRASRLGGADKASVEVDGRALLDHVLDAVEGCSPVIVVGLPRSGSTFLAHVLTSLRDWYVFDDLYFYQNVYNRRLHRDVLGEEARRQLLNFLGWQLRARIRLESIYQRPNCAWDDVEKMEHAVAAALRDRPVRWHELMEEWLTRLAVHHGRSRLTVFRRHIERRRRQRLRHFALRQ